MFLFFFVLSLKESCCSKFIHQIVNCLLGTPSLQNLHQNLYNAPWFTTLCTKCSWEQMANGADNCCLPRSNHKLPHCSQCNIILSSGPQINYFLSFQMSSALRHTDSSAKSYAPCSKWRTSHRGPEKQTLYPMYKRLGGPGEPVWHYGVKKNSCPWACHPAHNCSLVNILGYTNIKYLKIII
jgi:hypothetical protein